MTATKYMYACLESGNSTRRNLSEGSDHRTPQKDLREECSFETLKYWNSLSR